MDYKAKNIYYLDIFRKSLVSFEIGDYNLLHFGCATFLISSLIYMIIMGSNVTILNDIIPRQTAFLLIFLMPQLLHFFYGYFEQKCIFH